MENYSHKQDSYVRLRPDELMDVQLVHLMSGLDEELDFFRSDGAYATTICGYTEWVDRHTKRISIGWDWYLDVTTNQRVVRQINALRTNIMLFDFRQKDLGQKHTHSVIHSMINRLSWQREIQTLFDREM